MRRVFALVLAASTWACVGVGPLLGKATEEWTKTYPLAAGGEVRIGNTNGKVQIEGGTGPGVEVRALKTARAATDEGARQLLPRISIREDIKPDSVSIETERMGGIMIGASFDVEYRVKVPQGARITAKTTNGVVALNHVTGPISAQTSNGGVQATDVSGPIEARSTNGVVQVDLASLGAGPIKLSTTNGGVRLGLPDAAKATLSASWTNGGFNATGVKIDVTDENRRHIEGTINGGGTAIELRTTNGGIRVRSRAVSAESQAEKNSR